MNAAPDAFDFDAWRDRYAAMTYRDHRDTYSELWKLYPTQQHFDAEACGLFLDALSFPMRVLEIGGWDGELAARMLARQPHGISSWYNIEICREAVDATVPTAGPYQWVVPDIPVWDLELGRMFDTLVMSHSAEHMRWVELSRLLYRAVKAGVRAVYLASPLPTDGSEPDWRGYPGTHILECGWGTIGAFLGGLGFRQMEAPRTHEVRVWAKP